MTQAEPRWTRPASPVTCRIAYAAAHVVPRAGSDTSPAGEPDIDWDATLAFRRHLWSWGLGVAEAMDTAQRGMGLGWPAARELIRRSAAEAAACGGRIVAGACTDQLGAATSLDQVTAAYAEQIEAVSSAGAGVVIMASRHLRALAAGPDDYLRVYGRLLADAGRPVILHWLGPQFDPALAGYWGSADPAAAAEVVRTLVRDHEAKIDGVKLSLLDAAFERSLRAALPAGVRLYTGDDFNYAGLINGDGERHSDALLGAFAAIAPAASAALQALDRGDAAGYDSALEPTVSLSRHLFAGPARYYKTGIAFLAWLNGHQPGFTMIGGLHSGRSAAHLMRTYRLAAAAGVIEDPGLAASRLAHFEAVAGLAR
jgi:hypothetical protein